MGELETLKKNRKGLKTGMGPRQNGKKEAPGQMPSGSEKKWELTRPKGEEVPGGGV